ncbi:MAG: TetR/AcrR family transcriptional regulator [Microbacterium sp.]
MVKKTGLRERKKQQTREHIAGVAARLFAEHGYEHVSMTQVARATDVSEQTVYNYFPSKVKLLLDLDESLRTELASAVADRPAGVSVPAAVGAIALDLAIPDTGATTDELSGGLAVLAAKSAEVRRLVLEATDGYANTIAGVLVEVEGVEPAVARVRAVALASLVQTVTDEFGRRMIAGEELESITIALTKSLRAQIDDLEDWWA